MTTLDPYFVDFDDDTKTQDEPQDDTQDDGWAQIVEASADVEI